MGGVDLPGLRVQDAYFSILFHQTRAQSRAVGTKRHLIPAGMVQDSIVFTYLIGYNGFRNSRFKGGYRDQMLFFEGKHLGRYLLCCLVLLPVAGTGKPVHTLAVKLTDVRNGAVLVEVIFQVFHNGLNFALGFRIRSPAEINFKMQSKRVSLEPFCVDDVPMIL